VSCLSSCIIIYSCSLPSLPTVVSRVQRCPLRTVTIFISNCSVKSVLFFDFIEHRIILNICLKTYFCYFKQPASYLPCTRAVFDGLKRPQRESAHSPSSVAEVNVWGYTSTPLYAFIMRCLLVRGQFVFPLTYSSITCQESTEQYIACKISSSHGGEPEVQICLLGCTAV
jgi:hypothetical protein